jgi:hypothetical protein
MILEGLGPARLKVLAKLPREGKLLLKCRAVDSTRALLLP